MSKKLKNYPDPMELAAKYGADAMRFYMLDSPVVRGEELHFATTGVDEVLKKIIIRFDNVHAFYDMYKADAVIPVEMPKSSNVLDRWILARFQEVHAEVTHYLDTHELDKATRQIPQFIDDLSTWYLRRSRERFKSDDKKDATAARTTTGWILLHTAKLIAPFMPFITEEIYQQLDLVNKKESIHLEGWTAIGIADQELLEEMARARHIVSLALELRARAGIKVRQPLERLTIKEKMSDAMKLNIREEINVKEVLVDAAQKDEVLLDTTISPELEAEGQLRDLIRHVQELRKKSNLTPADKIVQKIFTSERGQAFVKKYTLLLRDSTNTTTIDFVHSSDATELVLGGEPFRISIEKIANG